MVISKFDLFLDLINTKNYTDLARYKIHMPVKFSVDCTNGAPRIVNITDPQTNRQTVRRTYLPKLKILASNKGIWQLWHPLTANGKSDRTRTMEQTRQKIGNTQTISQNKSVPKLGRMQHVNILNFRLFFREFSRKCMETPNLTRTTKCFGLCDNELGNAGATSGWCFQLCD